MHVRFDTDELLAAIEAADADVFVAEHSYMAESFLRSSHFGKRALVINTNVSESLVWLCDPRPAGPNRGAAVAARRTARGAGRRRGGHATTSRGRGVLSRQAGCAGARFMELTLPPTEQVDIAATTPTRLVLMGARDWPPNQEAFLRALELWPRIAKGIPDAELCVIGAKKPGAPDPDLPDGVSDLGFVDDLPSSSAPAEP